MTDKCVDCEASPNEKHCFYCKHQSDEDKLRNFDRLSDNYLSAFARVSKYLSGMIGWQGRHAMLKVENNALRRKLNKPDKSIPVSGIKEMVEELRKQISHSDADDCCDKTRNIMLSVFIKEINALTTD